MNILMLAANDPAGMGIAFTNAINRFSPHQCRLITTEIRYNFGFEKDIHIPDLSDRDFEMVEDLLESADLFHFHILSDETMPLGPLTVKDFIRDKMILHHHHGHPLFQKNHAAYEDKYKKLNRKAIVSTPDLLRLLPAAQWIPNVVPIQNPLYRPSECKEAKGGVIIGHSPTRRDLKKTDVFEKVLNRLMSQYPHVEKVIISDTLHPECLKMKKDCSIFFDQLGPSFGVSSLEALSQGLPTLARLDDLNIRQVCKFTGSEENPWINVQDEASLETALEQLVVDEDRRLGAGVFSRKFMEAYWNETAILHRLFEVYAAL